MKNQDLLYIRKKEKGRHTGDRGQGEGILSRVCGGVGVSGWGGRTYLLDSFWIERDRLNPLANGSL